MKTFNKSFMVSIRKILFFTIFLIICLNRVDAAGELTYLNIMLRGECFLTVRASYGTGIIGMDFEKGYASTQEGVVYSGLYMEPQYAIFVNPKEGEYQITIVGKSEWGDNCELDVSLIKGSTTTFSKTLSEYLKKGESREVGFVVYKFESYYDTTYQLWNIAPGSGKEALSEGLHKPYLEIIPNSIKIGLSAGENQEIPIIVKTPRCIPPEASSCSIVPINDITFSVTDLIGGEAPSFELPKNYTSFSDNGFSVEANSSKIIKLKVKNPKEVYKITYSGYISIKSSVGYNVIFVEADSDNVTETDPAVEFPTIAFDSEKAIASFQEISKDKESEIEIPKELNLPVNKIRFQPTDNLSNLQIITRNLKENDLMNMNISIINKTLYQYFEIIKNNDDKNIANIEVEFKVNKSWIENNNISSVNLFKFENNSWKSLKTEKISEDSNSVYYNAFSTTLSLFAIIGDVKPASGPQNLEAFQWYIYLVPLVVVIFLVIFLIKKFKKSKNITEQSTVSPPVSPSV
jgi:PGF-pre-PGF domain-containing protein